ncbi:MAG: hypothetical protein AABX82_09335 [Nanoarchaeota archaeon]
MAEKKMETEVCLENTVYVNGIKYDGIRLERNEKYDLCLEGIESPQRSAWRSIKSFMKGVLYYGCVAATIDCGYAIYSVQQSSEETVSVSEEKPFTYIRENKKGKAVLRHDAHSGETAQEISDLFDTVDQKNQYAETTKYNVVFANGKYVGNAPLKEGQTVYVVAAHG